MITNDNSLIHAGRTCDTCDRFSLPDRCSAGVVIRTKDHVEGSWCFIHVTPAERALMRELYPLPKCLQAWVSNGWELDFYPETAGIGQWVARKGKEIEFFMPDGRMLVTHRPRKNWKRMDVFHDTSMKLPRTALDPSEERVLW